MSILIYSFESATPSFPPNFSSLGSFYTTVKNDTTGKNIPGTSDVGPITKSKETQMEKEVTKIMEILRYIMTEIQLQTSLLLNVKQVFSLQRFQSHRDARKLSI
jgi:hypothetical protein